MYFSVPTDLMLVILLQTIGIQIGIIIYVPEVVLVVSGCAGDLWFQYSLDHQIPMVCLLLFILRNQKRYMLAHS